MGTHRWAVAAASAAARARRICEAVAVSALFAGIGVAGATPASAADLGSFTSIDCSIDGAQDVTEVLGGSVGDTFTVEGSIIYCNLASSSSGVVEWSATRGGADDPSGTNAFVPIYVTLAGAGTTTFTVRQNGYGYTFTVTSAAIPGPDSAVLPIPAWVQAYGRSGPDATCDEGWSPSWQAWAEPITAGWVCTRVIPSLGG